MADDEIRVLTKMSVATMGCNAGEAKVQGKEVLIARIIGRAGGIKQAKGKDGDVVYALTGSFKGTNVQNGQQFIAGVCYLPGGIQELILMPLDNALAGDENTPADPTATISFGFDIYSFPAPNPIGYSYRAVDLYAAKRINPLEDLEAEIAATKPLKLLAKA